MAMDHVADGVGEQGSKIARAPHPERKTVVEDDATAGGALGQATSSPHTDRHAPVARSQIHTGSEKRAVGEDVGVGVLEASVSRDAVRASSDEIRRSVHCVG